MADVPDPGGVGQILKKYPWGFLLIVLGTVVLIVWYERKNPGRIAAAVRGVPWLGPRAAGMAPPVKKV